MIDLTLEQKKHDKDSKILEEVREANLDLKTQLEEAKRIEEALRDQLEEKKWQIRSMSLRLSISERRLKNQSIMRISTGALSSSRTVQLS